MRRESRLLFWYYKLFVFGWRKFTQLKTNKSNRVKSSGQPSRWGQKSNNRGTWLKRWYKLLIIVIIKSFIIIIDLISSLLLYAHKTRRRRCECHKPHNTSNSNTYSYSSVNVKCGRKFGGFFSRLPSVCVAVGFNEEKGTPPFYGSLLCVWKPQL